MKSLQERITIMNSLLAPYAVPHEGLRGRPTPEPLDHLRTPLQHDRARIIHTTSFRRLAGKTQVFLVGESDHARTRLTHTMEVAQIARDIAPALGLNDALAECIALAHDLGHTPFGHSGQDALDAWLRERGDSFEHNVQSHRIVMVLEKRDEKNGLNLTRDVSDGLLKHGPAPLSLEAQLANAADEIAYTAHDSDDGLRAQLFSFEALTNIPLAAQAAALAHERNTRIRSTLIDLLARDLITHADTTLRTHGTPSIGLSPAMRDALRPLRAFLWEHMYQHPSVTERMQEGQRVIRILCDAYEASPPMAVRTLQERTGCSLSEAVKDYVSGMTDGFAMRQAQSV